MQQVIRRKVAVEPKGWIIVADAGADLDPGSKRPPLNS